MWCSLWAPALWPQAAVCVLLSCKVKCQLSIRQRVREVVRKEGFTLQCISWIIRASDMDGSSADKRTLHGVARISSVLERGAQTYHTSMFRAPPAALLSSAVPSARPGGPLGMPALAKCGSPIHWGSSASIWALPACPSAPAWP